MDQNRSPLLTAVIPVYNHEKYVRESVQSIIRQSYTNIELIVINDGSQDHSHEAVLTLTAECERRFVRFEYINRENRGVSATLNQALGIAAGKYFSVLASDDVALPNKFSRLVEALESSDESAAAAFGNASFIDEHGRAAGLDTKGNVHEAGSCKTFGTFLDLYTRQRNFDYRIEFGSYRTLIGGNYIPAMSGVLKTACIKEVGGWTEGNVLEDWEMWLKLSKQHKFLFIDETVALYRIHGQNSQQTMMPTLLRASLTLVAREKEYCVRHGLTREWKSSSYNLLFAVLRDGDSPIKDKLRELRSAGVLSFIGFHLRARCKRILS